MNQQPIDKNRVTHLVIAIHGIRTTAAWRDRVRDGIELDEHGNRDETIKVELVGYGYLDLFQFVLPFLFANRIANIVYAKIQGFRNEYPNATKLSIIAHSFGTYTIARILMAYPLRLHRLILCASIVPLKTDYWNAIRNAVTEQIRNDCSRRDIWPALAYALWSYGNSGNHGAQFPGVADVYHSFDAHSAFLTQEFAQHYWRPFLLSGALVQPAPDDAVTETPWYTSPLPTVLRIGQIAAVVFVMMLSAVLARRPLPLTHIRAGDVGLLSSWSYNLDTDEGVVKVQSAKDPVVIGKHFVIIAMRKPVDDTPVTDETRTVVTRVQRLGGAEGTIDPLKIPCARIAGRINYGDPVHFFLYIIPDDRVEALRAAVSAQNDRPLTIRQLEEQFGGIKRGGGTDGAAFDENGVMIQCALQALAEKRTSTPAGKPTLPIAPPLAN